MRINTLELTNVRGFTHAKLEFQPGFNLIVGINGVGKTTVLESLRVALSQILPDATISKNKKESLDYYDIQIGKDSLQIDTNFSIGEDSYSFVSSKQKNTTKVVETENIRAQTYDVQDYNEIKPSLPKKSKEDVEQPLGIYYSSHRSLMNEAAPSKSQASGGQLVAFSEALNSKREFSIRLFAEWFNTRERLADENPIYKDYTDRIREAIYTFLPGFSNLKVIRGDRDENLTFSIVKDKKTLSFQQLSDGEKSILALVFDIARRLTIANPFLTNPLKGYGVVLIDELDLHLHPKWQRSVVSDLERTFPNCQFIATTHSPQIIGEVKAEAITIIDRNHESEVYKPNVAFGLDAQRIIEELLESPIRNVNTLKEFEKINNHVDAEKYREAKESIEKLKMILGENDPELIRINSMIQFLEEDFEDEENS
ncbi:AAA family ATPase [Chryseobacterium sp.]|uniref:AAA family ATPase n=1 Tax=Chryseobacterium sp. TaxID=1871047 RepID=UPI00289C2521|nr:AAA family ATPase [Chryseobacterium sp.]